MNTLRILLLVLLGVGLVACEDDYTAIEAPNQVSMDLEGAGYLNVEAVADFGSVDGTFTVAISGEGYSTAWDDYQLEMEHKEWHSAGNNQYVITNGDFNLMDALGEAILKGFYSGQGLMDGDQRQEMSLVVQITENFDPEFQITNNTFSLRLHDFGENGECCFTLDGKCQSYGPPQ